MSTRKPTELSGASDERDALRARLRRRLRQLESSPSPGPITQALIAELREHLDWLAARAARYRAKAGGLGRTKKARP